MKCRKCNKIIPDYSVYCCFCGNKLIKLSDDISVPKPKKLSNGLYTAQLMVNGERFSVYGRTEIEYKTNVIAYKSGVLKNNSNKGDCLKLNNLMERYINSKRNLLSPSTIRGYYVILNSRFSGYINKSIKDIDFQSMINEESLICSPKTVKNAWNLVSASLKQYNYDVPKVLLPKNKKKDEPFLDFDQIEVFLKSIKGNKIELSAILALHSLRASELLALTVNDIYDNSIHVNKSMILGLDSKPVVVNQNKTEKSTRVIPVIISRLYEILPSDGYLCPYPEASIRKEINKICKANNLPEVGLHGLRRSFASLAYHLNWDERTIMLIGGWTNMNTVNKHYIYLSDSDVKDDIQKMEDYYKITTI